MVREGVGDSTAEASQHISRGSQMNIMTIYSLVERAVGRVAQVLRGRAKVGGETRAAETGSPLHVTTAVVHNIL